MFVLSRSPSSTLGQLRREMDRLFTDYLPDFSTGGFARAEVFPALNIWDEGERLVAEAEMPGLTLNDINVTVNRNELSIKGERKATFGEKASFHRRERAIGNFARTVTLPVEINADKVEAALKNGVLTIFLPKAEAAKARRITVKTA